MSRPYFYASAADVSAKLAGFNITATSKPSATQVDRLLANASDELDSILVVLDYAVPVATAATQSMEMLRSWTAVGAAYMTAMSMPQGNQSKHAEEYGKEWQAILKSVEGGRRQLPDAERVQNRAAARAGAPDRCAPVFNRANSQSMR